MLNLKFTIEAEEAKQALRNAPAVLEKHLAGGVEAVLALFHGAVHRNITTAFFGKPPAVNFGYLANAVDTSHDVPLHGEVFISPPADVYAAPVEYGTRPHWPPVAAIERWVEKKFGGNLSPAEVKNVAFLVSRKISKRGTQAHGMFNRAFNENREGAERLLNAAVASAIEEINRGSD